MSCAGYLAIFVKLARRYFLYRPAGGRCGFKKEKTHWSWLMMAIVSPSVKNINSLVLHTSNMVEHQCIEVNIIYTHTVYILQFCEVQNKQSHSQEQQE